MKINDEIIFFSSIVLLHTDELTDKLQYAARQQIAHLFQYR